MSLPLLHFTSLSPPEICGDIVETYRIAAEKLGYPTRFVERCFDPNAINILFFFWDVSWETLASMHPDCIVVNFEPMVPGTHAWRDNYLGVLKHCYLWEYSKTNFHRSEELSLNVADYVPLGFEAEATPILPESEVLLDAEQDIDVVFFGTMTQRRADVLDALVLRGVKLKATNGGQSWPIEERDGYLRRAKVVLNLHNWGNSRVVETPRLTILLRQRKAVVCELYPDSEIEPALRHAVEGATYDTFVDTVMTLLADPKRRAELQARGPLALAHRSQTKTLGPALDRFFQWNRQQRYSGYVSASDMQVVPVSVCIQHAEKQSFPTTTAADQPDNPRFELIAVRHASTSARTTTNSVRHYTGIVIDIPVACDAATAHNLALQEASGRYIVFGSDEGEDNPARFSRQVAFLDAFPEIDIVGSWVDVAGDIWKPGELDHDIKARLLGPKPLQLAACMIRRSFLQRTGVRHDPEFIHGSNFHFLCKCAVAGARFAAIPQVLHRKPSLYSLEQSLKPEQLVADAKKGRRVLLAALFPRLCYADISLMSELYAYHWPPEISFAKRILRILAKACSNLEPGLSTENETLARVLRHDAVRLLKVFHDANLANSSWLNQQMEEAEISLFLAPAGKLILHSERI